MKYYLLVLIVLISACTQTQPEIKEITISGHPVIYEFTNDIRKSINVPVENDFEIVKTISENNRMAFVFNGTSEKDNAIFAVTFFNIASKLSTFFNNEGFSMNQDTLYFVNETWYNETADAQENPDLSGIVIWLIGPETGAERNAVYMKNGYIFIEGTTTDELSMAGDRFILLVMGINNINDIAGA